MADVPAHQDAKLDVLEKQLKEAGVKLDAERDNVRLLMRALEGLQALVKIIRTV